MVGKKIWPAANDLVSLIQVNPHLIRGKRVLELGSGTGICGISAGVLGAACVVVTDYMPNQQILSVGAEGSIEISQVPQSTEILSLLRSNLSLNMHSLDRGSIFVRELEWGNPEQAIQLAAEFRSFDIIIGSEVIYTAGCASSIMKSLPYLMDDGTVALLVCQRRFGAMSLFGSNISPDCGLSVSISEKYSRCCRDSDVIILSRHRPSQRYPG
jgi:predicted nicotinamide N-methyase